jgi:hypothetical protein
MSAFGAAGQLAARGASRRPDAVQAARRNLTKSVRRAEDDRDPSTRAHRALQHAPPNCLRAGPPRGRSRCTCACPSAPVRCGCRRPTACESWRLRRWPGAGLSRHSVGAEQRELCCARQALDACLFAASSRAVGHRHRKLELDWQPAGRVAAGDAGTVARKPALEIDCPTPVGRAVAAAQQIHPGLGHRTTASLRRRQALRIRVVDSTGRNHAWIGQPSGRSGALAFAQIRAPAGVSGDRVSGRARRARPACAFIASGSDWSLPLSRERERPACCQSAKETATGQLPLSAARVTRPGSGLGCGAGSCARQRGPRRRRSSAVK